MVSYRINKTKFIVLMFFTLSVDILSIILTITGVGAIVDLVVTAVAYLIIIAYFRINKVKVLSINTIQRIADSKNSKSGRGRLLKKIASMIGELIPFLDVIVPGYTLFAYYTYKDSIEEDNARIKLEQENNENNQSTRKPRRGSVPTSGGNRMQNRRTRDANPWDKQNAGVSGPRTTTGRQRRTVGKYDYGTAKPFPATAGIKKAVNQ